MMTKFVKGDKVSAIDSVMDGVVKSVDGRQIMVETSDGFDLVFDQNELIKVHGTSILKSNSSSFDLNAIKKEKEVQKPAVSPPKKKIKGEIPPPEFDLHIEKLVKNPRGMSNYEILTIQSDTARRHIEFAMRHRIPKIIFIHGVGEGVLKSELDFLLGRYDNVIFRDADYRKYGVGATEVVFKQNAK